MNQLLDILGPITIITLIGFAMGKSSIGLQSRTLSNVVLLVATPSLVFHTLVSMHIGFATMGQMALSAAFVITFSGVLGLVGLWATGQSIRSFLPSLMMPNSGNMGLPLAALAFGEDGMRLGVSYFFVVALIQYSVGFSIAAGSLHLSSMLRQPLMYSVALVLIVTALDLTVPTMILTTTEMLGGMMIPAMLILLGSSLATLGVSDLRSAFAVAFGRLGLGIVSGLAVIWLLGLSGVAAGAVFILSTMPSAIVTFVFAERFSPEAGRVAGGVVVSTVLTFLCLPVIIWVALALAEPGMSAQGQP
jgi:hypothetical protein